MSHGDSDDQLELNNSKRTHHHHHAVGWNRRKSRHSALDFGGYCQIYWDYLNARRRCEGLNHGPLPNPRRSPLVANNAYARNLRRQFSQEVEPFGAQAKFELGEAGQIAAWACQAIHNPATNRIDGLSEYNWDCARGLLQNWCCWTNASQNHVRLLSD